MPRHVDAPTIGQQLEEALKSAGVSRIGLAQRLAAKDGTKPASKRRWIQKILKDRIDAPDMRAIEKELKLPPGHFVIPAPDQVERKRIHLEEVSAEVALLRAEQLTFAEEVLARLAALEGAQANEAQRSDRPSSRKKAGR